MTGAPDALAAVRSSIEATRALYLIGALAWLALVPRVRRPAFLLAGVLAANAAAWWMTEAPLQRPYAVGASRDRLHNLAACQVVAAGNSVAETWQAGQPQAQGRPHYRSWPLFVAVVSGFDADRVLVAYRWLPLAILLAFATSLYAALAARPVGDAGWQAATAALFATLLSSHALDFAGPYRVPWVMSFLLKPNHALALALAPLVLLALARARGWRGLLVATLLLHLVAWCFVLHFAYLVAGLVVFAALAWLSRAPTRARDARDVLVLVGLNGAAGVAYLWRLFAGHPFLTRSEVRLPDFAPHLSEPTLGTALVFPLAVYGGWVTWRAGERLGRLVVAQGVAALLIWASYLLLAPLELVRQPDESYYWLRLLSALLAGLGAWHAVGHVQAAWPGGLGRSAPARAALVGLLALPGTLPYWWDPLRMDRYFTAALEPLPAPLAAVAGRLRHATPGTAVVASDPALASMLAALGARRVLLADVNPPPEAERRERLLRSLVERGDAAAAGEARAFGVTHLVATPGLLRLYSTPLEALRGHPALREVLLAGEAQGEFVALFEIAAAEAP